MSRRNRQAARQRIAQRQQEQQRQREEERLGVLDRLLSDLESERMTARSSKEMFGYVRCGEVFYLRHLGVDDRLPSPISHRGDERPDVMRR